ncbi:uncharacterized protein EAE98_008458 [Botrytis deweyae]|uniref:Uncharacterized protein n=1 Tax=Botrytis deweyae TaxID=2478750 RepID=A0ABQ7IE96_9HELO|nr:uncharacterized protein EAE98_008458 [Botrytis deweyae]KAF7921611.1 hypothetical protein EAE98_008458 [Botrytis deweyae]
MQNVPPGGPNDPGQAENDRLHNLRRKDDKSSEQGYPKPIGLDSSQHQHVQRPHTSRLSKTKCGTNYQYAYCEGARTLWAQHHGIDEVPNNDWKEKWFDRKRKRKREEERREEKAGGEGGRRRREEKAGGEGERRGRAKRQREGEEEEEEKERYIRSSIESDI